MIAKTFTRTQPVVIMTEQEARLVVVQIKEHISATRVLLYDLYRRDGWRSLGYASWSECVQAEFHSSRSYLYRQLAAALIEERNQSPIGDMKESWIRAITEILKDIDEQNEAFEEARRRNASTALEYRAIAVEVFVKHRSDGLWNRLKEGGVALNSAYYIAMLVENLAGKDDIIEVISQTSDPQLAQAIVVLWQAGREVWHEIQATGCIPGLVEQIPLALATLKSLEYYLAIDDSERVARHTVERRELFRENLNRLLAAARDVVTLRTEASINNLAMVLEQTEIK